MDLYSYLCETSPNTKGKDYIESEHKNAEKEGKPVRKGKINFAVKRRKKRSELCCKENKKEN
jgi:hypothetical protein